jgi:DNA-binding transcriptional MerR regulator
MSNIISIQEFSKLSGIEASTLRYWDELGLFSPLERNPENNYRYYSTAQLLALNFVTVLSDLAIPLKTIAQLRKDRDPEKLMDLLERQEKDNNIVVLINDSGLKYLSTDLYE